VGFAGARGVFGVRERRLLLSLFRLDSLLLLLLSWAKAGTCWAPIENSGRASTSREKKRRNEGSERFLTKGLVHLSSSRKPMSAAVGVGLGLAELPPGSGRVEVTVVVAGGPAGASGQIRCVF
jgi:hypothetical protein